MPCFIELSIHIEKQRWENRVLNFDNCIVVSEHDATERFKLTPNVREMFQSQPLFCKLTMLYRDGSVEKLLVHASKHAILTKVGLANHANSFTPSVDTDAITREWEQKNAARFKFSHK